MKVELIAYTQPFAGFDDSAWGNPLKTVERCASVCYNSKPTDDCRIAKSCYDSNHISVFEHVNFTFHISDVSRSLLAQLSRHRHISLSVQSQRYVDLKDFDYIMPNFQDEQSELAAMEAMMSTNEIYQELIDRGEKKEDARCVLPNACCTELYMTANARALIEMSRLRLCNRAQSEIRKLFAEIKKHVALVSPEIADYMRPKCETNKDYPFCTERKGCGKHKNLREIYK